MLNTTNKIVNTGVYYIAFLFEEYTKEKAQNDKKFVPYNYDFGNLDKRLKYDGRGL